MTNTSVVSSSSQLNSYFLATLGDICCFYQLVSIYTKLWHTVSGLGQYQRNALLSAQVCIWAHILTCSNSLRLCICTGGPLSVSSPEKSAQVEEETYTHQLCKLTAITRRGAILLQEFNTLRVFYVYSFITQNKSAVYSVFNCKKQKAFDL